MNNREWSEKILKKFDSSFKHRWEIYDDVLKDSLNPETIWIDCGCGNNGAVKTFGKLAKTAIGIDIIGNGNKSNFIKADIRNLPFPADYADLITLRFVAEHFENADEYISELNRVIKSGGKIIILTTNLLSPFIFLPRMFLPFSVKNKIISKVFNVKPDDIFPTYHKINTPHRFKTQSNELKLSQIIFISDLNYTRRWVFIILMIWHKLTEIKMLRKFRTNILAILEKK